MVAPANIHFVIAQARDRVDNAIARQEALKEHINWLEAALHVKE
jgi:hypothetical protein